MIKVKGSSESKSEAIQTNQKTSILMLRITNFLWDIID